jgi:molybdopterin converting factor small subunit
VSEQTTQGSVSIIVRFITVMQQYSGQRELEMRVPSAPQEAIDMIIEQFQIPWSGVLEKSVRVFINKELLEAYKKSGRRLVEGDRISFIPISGGG